MSLLSNNKHNRDRELFCVQLKTDKDTAREQFITAANKSGVENLVWHVGTQCGIQVVLLKSLVLLFRKGMGIVNVSPDTRVQHKM